MSELSKCLLIDVGNTRIKYCVDHPSLQQMHFVSSLDDISLDGVTEVRIATVSRHKEIEEWTLKQSVPVRLAKVKKLHKGLRVVYEDEQKLGVDRWLALLAAWCELKSDACIVDMGTAITVDYLAADGSHKGGYIVPGYQLMKRSLGQNTAQVGYGGESYDTFLGKATQDCVDHGVNRMIEAFIASLMLAEPQVNRLIVTGGDAHRVDLRHRAENAIWDETLVIRGLRYCFE